ncbi:hypothetical protein ACKVAX_21435 [Klebsiella pasteurii]|uniref:hypothetical protein n=1 Tax=Klebsiella pasteurii TaxID=2587529 RepID=UPI003F1D9D36
MTTDITELAQREKFEAWFKSSFHPDKTGPYIKDQLYFAWKAAGAELVEALEKAQTKAIEQGRTACELFDEVTALRQRIAELESRTVKLPELCVGVVQDGHAVMVPYAAGHWFNKTAILEMLTAAGIKWEAE